MEEEAIMTRKWCVAIAVLFALAVALVIAIPTFLPPTPGVTYANYSRIEMGMARAQVDALLGSPEPHADDGPPDRDWYCWRSADGDLVTIGFDKNNGVESAHWNELRDERSRLEKLRDRLPWIAHTPYGRRSKML